MQSRMPRENRNQNNSCAVTTRSYKLLLAILSLLACSLAACNLPQGQVGTSGATSVSVAKSTQPGAGIAPSASPAITNTTLPTATRRPAVLSPEPVVTVIASNVSIPDNWHTYQNKEFGFQLRYPADGMLVADQPNSARIDLPFASGTNLQEKYLQIDIQENAGECNSPFASGYSPDAIQQHAISAGSNSFLQQSGSEGAAGNFYEWVGYSITEDRLCVSLTFVLHSLDPYNFATPALEFDAQREAAVFNSILSSFQWVP